MDLIAAECFPEESQLARVRPIEKQIDSPPALARAILGHVNLRIRVVKDLDWSRDFQPRGLEAPHPNCFRYEARTLPERRRQPLRRR